MRRVEILAAVHRVLKDVAKSGLETALQAAFEGMRGEDNNKTRRSPLIPALHAFGKSAANYGPVEMHILKIMDLDGILDPDGWSEFPNSPGEAHRYFSQIRQLSDFLPRILDLFENEASTEEKSIKSQPESPVKVLTVLMIEPKGQLSKIDRVVEMFTAIADFYHVCAVINGEPAEKQLLLLGCDSGSDKSFDFLGVAKLVECTKDIILSLWDRVVFYREKKFTERIDLIAKSLPIIDKIAELERDQKLSPEQSEILRRKVLKGAESFISAGGVVPELYEHASFNPRALMAPKPKLLAAPQSNITNTSEQQTESSEERQLLARLEELRKSRSPENKGT